MGSVICLIVVAIIAEVVLIKFFAEGGKQLEKYNSLNSKVDVGNAEMLVSKLENLSGAGIKKIECQENTVILKCKGTKYLINVVNGIASVEYDKSGCRVKLSKVGRILRVFKFSKAVKRAIVINTIMDNISGNAGFESEKEYSKVKKLKNMLFGLLLAVIVLTLIVMFSLTGDKYSEAIDRVKNQEYDSGVTYGEIIDSYVLNPEWEAFNEVEKQQPTVEVNGINSNNDKVCIQFVGELGMGFNGVENQDFKIFYFDVNGESVDPNQAIQLIYESMK